MADSDLQEIDALADAYGLPRTAYMTKASTGSPQAHPADRRFDDLELRVARLEAYSGLTTN
jgi:hypothetical protein